MKIMSCAGPASHQRPSSPSCKEPAATISDEVLLKIPLGASPSDLVELAADYQGIVTEVYEIPDSMSKKFNGQLVLLKLEDDRLGAEAMTAMQSDDRILMAAPNHLMELARTPDDLDSSQWNLRNDGAWGVSGADIDAERAWDLTVGSRTSGPVIAVLDSGIDVNHPDLRANLWRNPGEVLDGLDNDGNGIVDDIHGVNTYLNNGDLTDSIGHGTHVAGIIGAVGNNGIGISGVAWEAQMMALNVADPQGRVSTSGAIFATLYAAEHGATVVNNSWGGPAPNPILKNVMESAPCLFVCAAGNAESDTDVKPFYPASYELDNVLSVAMSTPSDEHFPLSNRGLESVDLHATRDSDSFYPAGWRLQPFERH